MFHWGHRAARLLQSHQLLTSWFHATTITRGTTVYLKPITVTGCTTQKKIKIKVMLMLIFERAGATCKKHFPTPVQPNSSPSLSNQQIRLLLKCNKNIKTDICCVWSEIYASNYIRCISPNTVLCFFSPPPHSHRGLCQIEQLAVKKKRKKINVAV